MNREVELGSYSWMHGLAAQLFLNRCGVQVLETLFPTTIERVSYGVCKLLYADWLPTTIIAVVLIVAVLLAFARRSAKDGHCISTLTLGTGIA